MNQSSVDYLHTLRASWLLPVLYRYSLVPRILCKILNWNRTTLCPLIVLKQILQTLSQSILVWSWFKNLDNLFLMPSYCTGHLGCHKNTWTHCLLIEQWGKEGWLVCINQNFIHLICLETTSGIFRF